MLYNTKLDEKTQLDISQLLLDAGARVVVTDSPCVTPMHHAQFPSLMKLFLSTSSRTTPNVNVKELTGNTPLQFQAVNGRAENCRMLIEAKADVNTGC